MKTTTPFLGLRTCLYYVTDLKEATEWYTKVLTKEPYFNEAYYVGFEVAGYELGILPTTEKRNTGISQEVYWGVEDIAGEFNRLIELGAGEVEKPNDVGDGIMVARVKDPWENVIGIIYNPYFMTDPVSAPDEARVTGLGGVFFKSPDPEKLKKWYDENLGIPAGQYGATFEWRSARYPEKKGFTAWGVFTENTDYFDPGQQESMINYRVNDLKALIEKLKSRGVQVVGEIQEFDYGKFGWIMDPDGNKIELWEPDDDVYSTMGDNTIK